MSDTLFDKGHSWDEAWRGMPAFEQEPLKPYHSINVQLRNETDTREFEKLLGGRIYHEKEPREERGKKVPGGGWVWYPPKGYGNFRSQRWTCAEPVLPRYPVYVISKGRWESRMTVKSLEQLGVPYFIAVEPQEADRYRAVIDPAKVLVTPFSNLGLGSIPVRNFVWEHAAGLGAERFWTLDDNIGGFYRLHQNAKIQSNSGAFFRAIEDWSDRYSNVAISGMQYELFAPRRERHDPFDLNTRVYSCILIKTDLKLGTTGVGQWGGPGDCGVPYGGGGLRYNEDTDLSLRALKAGWCTALFYAFLANKTATMKMSGGNTDELYAGTESTFKAWEAHASSCDACRADEPWTCDEARRILEPDGRWRMAVALRDAHPDVTTISRRWSRFQHVVDYSSFKKHNKLELKPGLVIPEGVNEYGMELKPWDGAPDPEPEEAEEAEDPLKPTFAFTFSAVGPTPNVQVELLSTLATVPKPDGWVPDALEPIPADVTEVFLDSETTGLRWWEGDRPCGWAVSYRRSDGKIISRYHPFAHADGNLDEVRVREWFRTELRGRTVSNLNTRFDAHMAREWGADLVEMGCTLADVGHDAALLDDHRREFSLESLARDLLGEGKVRGLDMSRGAAVYPAWMVDSYARQDTALPARIAAIQAPKLRYEELDRVVALERAVLPVVLEMERNAAPIDVGKLERWVRDSEAELQALRTELTRAVGWSFNPDSRLDMERLFRERGLPIDVRTPPSERYPEGQPSFTDAVLEKLEGRDPAIRMIRRAGHLADLRAKFLVPYLETTRGSGLLRYAFHQLRCDREEGGQQGTVSGRFSCTQPVRGVGANVQQVFAVSKQLKRDCLACREGDAAGRKISLGRHRSEGHPEAYLIRELFLPGSGLLAAPDAKQIEFRIFAHFSGSERLARMYREDPETDFHAVVGDMVAQLRPDFDRKNVKMLNFGKLFGAGRAKIGEMLAASESEVRGFLKTYDAAFPETSQTLKRAMTVAEQRGYVKTVLGRRVRFPEGCKCGACVTYGPRYHKALNGVVQGTAADIMKVKLAELYAQRKELGITLRATVHDEVVMDVPDADAARRVGELLDTQSVALRTPILWDTKTGRTWADC